VDHDDIDVRNFVFFENDIDFLTFFIECLDSLSSYFGEEVCGVIAYSFGRGLGERVYKLAVKHGIRDLKNANDFLLWIVKRFRFAKDAAVFILKPRDGFALEMLFRIASSGRDDKGNLVFYILRGLLFQFYKLFTLGMVRVSSLNRSNSLISSYEYIVRVSEDPNWRK